ncbi:MAG: endonuclease III [Actinobacteria bacterium]|nr:endonuclease III [Actinomycetota bacterium]
MKGSEQGEKRGGEEKVRAIDSRLLKCYGDRPWSPRFPSLLDGLVHTILSQNTSDVNSHRAFDELKKRFPEWEEAASSPVDGVEAAIRSGGISRVKAERIKAILGMLRARSGSFSLEFLGDMEASEALAYLLDLPGVGRKTAAVLLLFQLGYPFFPVDTHILRVGKRLGLMPAKATPERAHDIMDEAVPDDIKFRLHINLIEHGRRVCKARKPLCSKCCLKEICPRIGIEPVEA